MQASIDAARPPPSPKGIIAPEPESVILPALSKMESGLQAGQRECLTLLGEMRETSSRHEDSIRDMLSQDLR